MISNSEATTMWKQMGGLLYNKKRLIESYLELARKYIGDKVNEVDDIMFDGHGEAILFMAGGIVIFCFGKNG